MSNSTQKEKGYGGIETYCLVDSNQYNDDCIAIIEGLSDEEILKIKSQFEEIRNGRKISEKSDKFAPSKETFRRAKKLRLLLIH